MSQSISVAPGHGKELPKERPSNEYSPDLKELKKEIAEECKYLISDPSQLFGMAESLHSFCKFGDEHFNKAYNTIIPLLEAYYNKKIEDPAYKIDPLEKSQIQTAGEVIGNLSITLSPSEFKEGVQNCLESLLEQLGSHKKTPQLLAKLTGVVSALCSLPCFAADPSMNDLFFDLSTYTMGDATSVSIPQITESINKILKKLGD
jgi:hypothetical protein